MWSLMEKYVRCGNNYCRACKQDAAKRPHGPYYSLKRHQPGGGPSDKQEVYIGSPKVHDWVVNDYVRRSLVEYLDVRWSGKKTPSREFVLMVGRRMARGLAVI
jgi:hypothetical protein